MPSDMAGMRLREASPDVVEEKRDRLKPREKAERLPDRDNCKKRPEDSTSKGGRSRPFIPYCSKGK